MEIRRIVLWMIATLLVVGMVAAEQTNTVRDKIVQKSLETAGDGWTYVGIYIVDSDNETSLVVLKKNETLKYIEVYKVGNSLKAREVVPKTIERKVERKVEFLKTTKNEEPATIVKERGILLKELRLITTSVTVVEAWSGIEAKNALGITLWKLTAKGYFHVYPGDRVFYVADNSSVYANGFLGWNVEYFDSDATWTSVAGRVDARAGFDNVLPGVDDVDAWAWVQVDKYLHITRDGGYT
ncbi:hypothetical protein [Geoglobus sp.]